MGITVARERRQGPRDRVTVFDVNETLLDITVLEPLFGAVFGDPRVMPQPDIVGPDLLTVAERIVAADP